MTREFKYGGTIISNGDVGLNGRTEEEKVAMIGNNHGGLVCADDQWYIFYHRHTHCNALSRQGCAEPITIGEDGVISQVEITSCGLNKNPLDGEGEYPAIICCNLSNGSMPNHTTEIPLRPYPFITNHGEERFITGIDDGTFIGYKYFELSKTNSITLRYRGEGNGHVIITSSDEDVIAQLQISSSKDWKEASSIVKFPEGTQPIYFKYQGDGSIDLISFRLNIEEI